VEEEEEQQQEEAEEEEEEEEGGDGEDDQTRLKRLRGIVQNGKKKARQNGIRAFAIASGCAAGAGSYGNDLVKRVLSTADVARLAHWCPASAADSFVALAQFETHLALRDESLSSGPLAVLADNVESLARKIVDDAVMRNMETTNGNGPAKVSVNNMKGALRPIADALHIEDLLMPHGIVRSAQTTRKGKVEKVDGKNVYVESEQTILKHQESTEAAIAEERKFLKANHAKRLKEADKAIATKRESRKRARSSKSDAEPEPAGATATVG
jgi:hypothetical protein